MVTRPEYPAPGESSSTDCTAEVPFSEATAAAPVPSRPLPRDSNVTVGGTVYSDPPLVTVTAVITPETRGRSESPPAAVPAAGDALILREVPSHS